MIKNQPVYINGDGETSRDFCYIENTIQVNLLAATANNEEAVTQVYNVAVGDRTSLDNPTSTCMTTSPESFHASMMQYQCMAPSALAMYGTHLLASEILHVYSATTNLSLE